MHTQTNSHFKSCMQFSVLTPMSNLLNLPIKTASLQFRACKVNRVNEKKTVFCLPASQLMTTILYIFFFKREITMFKIDES